MRRLFFILFFLSAFCIRIFSASFSIVGTIPEPNSTLQSIQEITLIFDFEDYKNENPTATNWHIGCNVWGGDPVLALKNSQGEIVAQIIDNDDSYSGDTFTFSFDNPVVLSPEEEYTLFISGYSFSLFSKGSWKGYVTTNEECEFKFYGAQGSSKILTITEVSPAANSEWENLDTIQLYFNEQIELSPDAKAYLYEKGQDEPIGECEIELAEDERSIRLAFPDVLLLNTHYYEVEVPTNTVFLKGESDNSYQRVSIEYRGTGHKYFGYGRVSPGNDKSVEYLGVVTVPVDCAQAEYLGRNFKVYANLYRLNGDERELIGEPIQCVVTETAKGFYINVYNFDLQPASDYQLIVAADQFNLWTYETQKPMYDTANEELVLNYHTPEVLNPVPWQQFGELTPGSGSVADKLESFKLTFLPYSFDNMTYYPVFTSYQQGYNVLKVVDESTEEEVASFNVDIRWDRDNNYWLENVEPLDIVLLDGHAYKVVVPAGMFCCYFEPLRDVSLNKEYKATYTGSYRTSFAVTCNYGDAVSITNVVNRGEDATIRFSPSEEWGIDKVLLNEEAVELEDNTLVIPEVSEDKDVYVAYSFTGGVMFDYTTEVQDVEAECPYGISLESGHVIISNLEVGSDVKVFNTVGMLMAESRVTEPLLKISVNPGIVVVVIYKSDSTPVGLTVRIPE